MEIQNILSKTSCCSGAGSRIKKLGLADDSSAGFVVGSDGYLRWADLGGALSKTYHFTSPAWVLAGADGSVTCVAWTCAD